MPRPLLVLLAAAALCAAAAAPADALRLPKVFKAVAGNPADRLADRPIEDAVYDPARRCTRKRRPGVEAFAAWLQANARGQSWGSYRCEKWGRGQASLHAEGRALDWHLDAARKRDRRQARKLILLLLAPDRAGNAQALARRMGIQEIIWDCRYWAAGMDRPTKYRACYTKRGKRRRRISPTAAHRDHVHFGLTKAAAAGKTSFWRRSGQL